MLEKNKNITIKMIDGLGPPLGGGCDLYQNHSYEYTELSKENQFCLYMNYQTYITRFNCYQFQLLLQIKSTLPQKCSQTKHSMNI